MVCSQLIWTECICACSVRTNFYGLIVPGLNLSAPVMSGPIVSAPIASGPVVTAPIEPGPYVSA